MVSGSPKKNTTVHSNRFCRKNHSDNSFSFQLARKTLAQTSRRPSRPSRTLVTRTILTHWRLLASMLMQPSGVVAVEMRTTSKGRTPSRARTSRTPSRDRTRRTTTKPAADDDEQDCQHSGLTTSPYFFSLHSWCAGLGEVRPGVDPSIHSNRVAQSLMIPICIVHILSIPQVDCHYVFMYLSILT